MKKIIFFIMIALGICKVYANPIDENTAKVVGANFLTTKGKNSKLKNSGELKLVYTKHYSSNLKTSFEKSHLYIFNVDSGGFVIVSGDDSTLPILGYSLEGKFNTKNMPDNVAGWLNGYEREIKFIISKNSQTSKKIAEEWNNLKIGKSSISKTATSVSPMVQTKWGQGSYYNSQCPSGVPTGCVATAMAQVMKYWNYPATGSGYYSYNCPNYGILSADFGSTTYQWNAMPNQVTSQNNAISTLMYHCGVSIDMQYNPTGSGSTSEDVAIALKGYFGYSSSTQWISRLNISDVDWIFKIKNELNNQRPILYSGYSSTVGHAVVCDGYDNNDYFHFNWGWDGLADGYYQINSLNPNGTTDGFNSAQNAVIQIKPADNTENDTPFVTIWKPNNLSSVANGMTTSSNTQVNFPVIGRNFTISWEEVGFPAHNGTIKNINARYQNPTLIEFGTPQNPNPSIATYKVSCSGNGFTRISFVNNFGDSNKLLYVTQWGDTKWTDLSYAFQNCNNLDITATDIPNLTQTIDLLGMFMNASNLVGNSSFSSWDTSNIRYMGGLFWGATLFNQDIGSWNTSNVKDMGSMFYNTSFNKNINNWDTSNVTSMSSMFSNTSSFNQNISSWNTSKVNDMHSMFYKSVFNQDISNWDTSNVLFMTSMFGETSKFNQPIGKWNTKNVIDMFGMFSNSLAFNQDISTWDTSNVVTMNYMFINAKGFNQSIGSWNLSKLTNNQNMLDNSGISCINYDKTLVGWANNSKTPNNLNMGSQNIVYSSNDGVTARNTLINTKGWTITGDKYSASCNNLSTATVTQPSCSNSTGTITFTATTGFSYSINNGTSWSTSNIFSSLAPGTYTLVQKDAGGYISPSITITINNPPANPTLTLQNATLDMAGSNTVSLAQNQVVVSVADPCDNTPVITLSPNSFNAVGTYTVTVTAKDSYGRTATGTATVTVKDSFANITDLFNIQVSDETCDIKNNGAIQITSTKNLNYSYSLNGGAWLAFTGNTTIGSLNSGAYDLCIKLPSSAQYCYQLQVGKPAKLTGKISSSGKTATIVITNGTAPFTIQYGTKYINVAEKSTVQIPLDDSATEITLTSAKLCEGKITQKVANINNISLYPNPVNDILNISLPSSSETFCKVAIYNTAQQIVLQKEHSLNSNNLLINVNNLPTGEYIIVINFGKTSLTKKFIKQ